MHRITLIVSHSSYHTRRITLPRYFRWNMTNIGAINITLVYDNKRLSHGWQCDMIFIKRVISHQHEFDKIISQCHPCDYLFIIYHNTRTNRNFVHTYHSHIYYTSTYCHFLTLQIAVCLSCQTQQAIHNALCDVLWQNKYYKKKFKKKISKK